MEFSIYKNVQKLSAGAVNSFFYKINDVIIDMQCKYNRANYF